MNSRRFPRVLGPAAIAVSVLLAAPPARAQSAVSSVARSVSGTIVSPDAETVLCSGQATVQTTAVADPLQPGMLVSIDARGLTCVGAVSKASYLNTGEVTLTRLFGPGDVIRTPIAVYPNVPGGFLAARSGVLVLSLAYDTATGALSSATAGLEPAP